MLNNGEFYTFMPLKALLKIVNITFFLYKDRTVRCYKPTVGNHWHVLFVVYLLLYQFGARVHCIEEERHVFLIYSHLSSQIYDWDTICQMLTEEPIITLYMFCCKAVKI